MLGFVEGSQCAVCFRTLSFSVTLVHEVLKEPLLIGLKM